MNKTTNISRSSSFWILTAIYVAATIVGWITYRAATPLLPSYIWGLFAADVAATIFVWIWGIAFRNVSVYDPYWSVLPPVMLTLLVWGKGPLGIAQWLLLIAIWLWAIRLTGNWAYTFKGMAFEDWRYTKYREEQKPIIFQLINFFGLNFMPTLVVFLAMLPGIRILEHGAAANIWSWVGFFVSIGAATIQLVADTERHRFSRNHRGEICKVGLWKHGRHPNYFGEISMWWGVWIMSLPCTDLTKDWTLLVGPIMMTCLFLCISIPLMESRQKKNKPGYEEYKKETRILI